MIQKMGRGRKRETERWMVEREREKNEEVADETRNLRKA